MRTGSPSDPDALALGPRDGGICLELVPVVEEDCEPRAHSFAESLDLSQRTLGVQADVAVGRWPAGDGFRRLHTRPASGRALACAGGTVLAASIVFKRVARGQEARVVVRRLPQPQ